MRKISLLFVAVLLSAVSLFNILCAEPLDMIAAKVGREIILKSELDRRVLQLQATGIPATEIDEFEVLNDLIESKLILAEAKAQGFEVDPIQMKEAAEEQVKKVSSQFGTQAEFKQALKQEMGLTIPELKEYYLEMIQEQSLQEQIITDQIRTKISVTDIEVEEYFQEHQSEIPKRPQMSQIGLIVREIKPSDETRNRCLETINKVLDRLNDGEDFDEVLASEAGVTGGNLGFIERGMMVKEFENSAFALQPGEFSNAVETKFGYHVIKLNEKKGNQIDVSHILCVLEATELDVKSNVELMESVLEQLDDGGDFGELAAKYSEDDESAVNNGILGEFTNETMPYEYSEELAKIETGNYSRLIRDGEKILILAKLADIAERDYSYDEVSDRLQSVVMGEKEQELYQNWTKELVKKYYVEVLLD